MADRGDARSRLAGSAPPRCRVPQVRLRGRGRAGALALVLIPAGCGSSAKPHAFRLYKLVWPGSDAELITIGYEQPSSLRSPNGRLVAVGGDEELKIVDLVHRRARGVPFGANCAEWPVLWQRQDRLVLRLWCGDVHSTSRSELLVLDPARWRFVGRREIGNATAKQTTAGTVLLAGPPLGARVDGTTARLERLGAARLLRVSPDGRVDEIRLPITALDGANCR